MTAGLAELLEQAVDDGVFPGAVLRVEAERRCLHQSAHGRSRTDEPGEAVKPATCFDLASLTKILSTTSLMMLACAAGELALDARVKDFLPGFSDERVSLRHLLEHSSGLMAWKPFFERVPKRQRGTAAGQRAIRELVLAEGLQRAPGDEAEYSDLGFILLDWILERRLGAPCDELFARRVAGPLEIEDLFFIDLKDGKKAEAARGSRGFAATENCLWRERVLVGEVHDDNTWAMGGVSGHAGLFGTADAVARVAQEWMSAGQGRESLFDPATVKAFWTPSEVPGSSRCLGFDRPAAEHSQAGCRMGPRTVGHLGFTGCSLWLDPEREFSVVLLSNRVHPSRENESIKQFRPVAHDRVMEAFAR